jgi:hypothetical protein
MANQVVEPAGLEISSKPSVLDVALDQAMTFQHMGHVCADLPDQPLQLVRTRPCHGAELRRVGALEQIHPVQKQHVKVDVQVQRRAKALNQRHGPGRGAGAREAGLADEIVRDGPVHHAEDLRECGRVRGQQEPQRVWQ